jgi:hypothetical protein
VNRPDTCRSMTWHNLRCRPLVPWQRASTFKCLASISATVSKFCQKKSDCKKNIPSVDEFATYFTVVYFSINQSKINFVTILTFYFSLFRKVKPKLGCNTTTNFISLPHPKYSHFPFLRRLFMSHLSTIVTVA